MVTPGSNQDPGDAQAIAVTVLHWAMSTLGDKLVRRDAWEAIARVCKREADKLMIDLKHEARLDWRKPEASRTPSGLSKAVSEVLAEGANQHPEKEKP